MKRAWLVSSVAALALISLSLPRGAWGAAERPGPLVGKPAPQFQIQGIYGESYSLETFKGHILVMQFGTSW